MPKASLIEISDPEPLTLPWFLARLEHPSVNASELDAIWTEACQCLLRCKLRELEIRQIEQAIKAKRIELTAEADQLLIGAAKLPRQKSLF